MIDDSSLSDLEKTRKILESLLAPASDVIRPLGPDAIPKDYLKLLDSAFGTVEDGEELLVRFMNTLQDQVAVARNEAVSGRVRVPSVNMAEDLLETVDRLQSRLGENQEPRKLVKALRRLGELPMTVEILVETGVGKAVNSLRKHDIVGELAKNLVAKWKKLVPQSSDRPSNSHHSKPQSHRVEERSHRRVRDPSPEPSPEPTYEQDEPEEEEEEEEEGYNPNYSPQYSSPQRNSYQSDEYDSPQPEPSPPPAPPPPRKDPKQSSKPSKDVHKNHHQSRDRTEKRQPGSNDRKEGKKSDEARWEIHHSPEQKVPKHKKPSPQEPKRDDKKVRLKAPKDSPSNEDEEVYETPTMSFESFLTYDAPSSVKKKKKPPPPSAPVSSHSRSVHSSSSSSSSSTRPAAPSSSSSQSSSSSSKVSKSNNNGSSSSKRPHSSSKSSSSSGPTPEKRKKIVEPVPVLPDIPLPAIQPNYRPLPSIDVTPLSPQRRKVAVCTDEEDAGFTGRRLNSKMVVFSGSKTSYLPRMMTLYEQCIRVLQNNIDSIAEVGGVPFEILEPVLERCTPEQLYRIEQSNQWFTEDSDELWMRHCRRDFKREQPQEYESWREMYLRLHDEREERLKMLTQNISSAHANKPKGRQVKMAFVNSVAKPPRDVRRRQERFGTSSGSSASSTAAAAPIKIRPVFAAPQSDPSAPSSSSFSPSSSTPRPSP
ncbi:hypothetical protein WMY93_019359 [Mugilogobius chulae]|uniref:TFIIS N-terminal domain-containing protein n=1 Tax=Mugilogobius chulae TaxID=88201 RepID=A0AAW0NKX4_9GOBI